MLAQLESARRQLEAFADPRIRLIRNREPRGISACHNLVIDQSDFLDKVKTLELAEAVGVGAPRHWATETEDQLHALRGQVKFPVMVKPVQSHRFIKVFVGAIRDL